jgi:hypothetical protein
MRTIVILLMLFITNKSYSQITATDWETGKKLYEIKSGVIKNWVTNERLFEFKDGVFTNTKTGEKVYVLEDGILINNSTGLKVCEYRNKAFISVSSGKSLYQFDSSDKTISDAGTGKRLFGLSQASVFAHNLYLILIAADLIK